MTQSKIKLDAIDPSIISGKFSINGTEQILMCSQTNNLKYQIFMFSPTEDPPPLGYPVIYVLDANSVFGTFVEAMRLQSSRPEKSGVASAVIVGIGYLTDTPFSPCRHYDFTMPSSVIDLSKRPDGTPWPRRGGAKHFLKFIEEDLKPKINSRYNIDSTRQTLFGHSLGGLFVLQTLYARPDLFQTYIAGSPSIYLNQKFFFEKEEEFQSKLRQENINVDVFVGVGELEKHHKSHMNENAREFSNRLSGLKNCGVRVVKFKEFEGEGHLSILPTFINRALRFALKPRDTKLLK